MFIVKNYLTNIKSCVIIGSYGKERSEMDERKNEVIGKIKATSAPARAFVIIVGILLLAYGMLNMIGAFIVQSKGLPTGSGMLKLIGKVSTKEEAAGLMVSRALLVWLEANVLFELGRMLRKIADDGLPFKPLGKSFRVCGMLLMIGMFVPTLIGSAVTGILCQLSDAPLSWSLVFDLRLDLLLTAFIVLILSRIFEYGALLQQEADDTV